MNERDTVRQPGQAPLPDQPMDFDPVGESKRLLRQIRSGALATLDPGGYPFASLVAVATDMDGSPLLLLSGLSAHTRNLTIDPRVSLLLSQGGKGDPLAHPRLTVMGLVTPFESQTARARYLSRHPKAANYAGFGDFGLYRLAIEGGHLNGGFARAARLSAEELTTDITGMEALAEREAGAVEHMNADHADAVALYATGILGRRAGAWRLTGIDPEGLDLLLADEAARLVFPERLAEPGAMRPMLVELATAARASQN
jgi:putative heme iron utilization protein